MKFRLIWALLIAFAQFAIAEETPAVSQTRITSHEHRGFFFSAGVGMSRVYFESEKQSDRGNVNGGIFSAYDIPSLDFKIGKSIGNVVSIYILMDVSLMSGKSESFSVNRLNDGSIVRHEYEDNNTVGVAAFYGLGFNLYPFRNPNSMMNGFYFGYSYDNGNFGYYLPKHHGLENYDVVFDCAGHRFEIGKDWWVSKTWSMGISISYNLFNLAVGDDVSGEANKIQLAFRLTRG